MTRSVILDTQNLLHRARSGFVKGPHFVTYNFFRGLRPLIEKLEPDHVVAVLEGSPKDRRELQANYKANRPRVTDMREDDPKRIGLEDFHRQASATVGLMEYLPIDVIRDGNFECDDVIASACKRSHDDEVVIVSTDTDFIQLLDDARIQLYNPVRKEFVEHKFVGHEYVAWKALVGDPTDNVRGLRGIGPKRAAGIIERMRRSGGDRDVLLEMGQSPSAVDLYEHNIGMIELSHMSPGPETISDHGTWDFAALREEFRRMEFVSITDDRPWYKFVSTFMPLTCVA